MKKTKPKKLMSCEVSNMNYVLKEKDGGVWIDVDGPASAANITPSTSHAIILDEDTSIDAIKKLIRMLRRIIKVEEKEEQ